MCYKKKNKRIIFFEIDQTVNDSLTEDRSPEQNLAYSEKNEILSFSKKRVY